MMDSLIELFPFVLLIAICLALCVLFGQRTALACRREHRGDYANSVQ